MCIYEAGASHTRHLAPSRNKLRPHAAHAVRSRHEFTARDHLGTLAHLNGHAIWRNADPNRAAISINDPKPSTLWVRILHDGSIRIIHKHVGRQSRHEARIVVPADPAILGHLTLFFRSWRLLGREVVQQSALALVRLTQRLAEVGSVGFHLRRHDAIHLFSKETDDLLHLGTQGFAVLLQLWDFLLGPQIFRQGPGELSLVFLSARRIREWVEVERALGKIWLVPQLFFAMGPTSIVH
mmetsp:Transcript_34574/g.74573  ORF Transcript_34574/g.74573 Transcript_34574/m.74573 type:complete len:239 (+) Transcript_34574:265-981(+)